MQINDLVVLDGVRRTGDGYLVASAKVARTGIQIYRGSEVGKPEMIAVRVFRPEAEVFDTAAMHSFAHRPVTLNHPSELVTADNWQQLAKGWTGDEVARDGEHIRVPMLIADAETIRAVEGGKRQLSMGYTTDLKWEPGTTPSGEAYDAIQTSIRANHLAVVAAARGGPELRIGDTQEELLMTLKTVTVDGIPIEVTDQGATVINTLQQRLSDSAANTAKLTNDHTVAIAAKDGELAKKDAEIDALKAKVLDTAALDAAVRARGDLIAKAKAIAPAVVTDGKADADIRRDVVVAKLGDAAIKDKPAAYIDARFDILAEDAAPGDPLRRTIAAGITASDGAAVDTAHKAMTDHLSSAWQTQKGAA